MALAELPVLIDKPIDPSLSSNFLKFIQHLKLDPSEGIIAGSAAMALALGNSKLLDSDVDIFIPNDEVDENNSFKSKLEKIRTVLTETAQKLFPDAIRPILPLETKSKLNSYLINDGEFIVQVIIFKKFSSQIGLLQTFDLSICEFCTDGHVVSGTKQAWDALENKTITLMDDRDINHRRSLKRLFKYSVRNYNTPLSEWRKIFEKLNSEDLIEFDSNCLQFSVAYDSDCDEDYDD